MQEQRESGCSPWGNALLSQLELQPKLRELAILQVAQESGADYEWVQHVPLALSTQAQIEAIEQGSLPRGLFTAQEQQVLHFTKEVYSGRTISSECLGKKVCKKTKSCR